MFEFIVYIVFILLFAVMFIKESNVWKTYAYGYEIPRFVDLKSLYTGPVGV